MKILVDMVFSGARLQSDLPVAGQLVQGQSTCHLFRYEKSNLKKTVVEEVHSGFIHEVGRSETGKLWFWYRKDPTVTARRGYQLRRFCPPGRRISVGKPCKYVAHATL